MAVGIGIDLVAVSTVAESLRGEHRDHYLERIYTAREVDDCLGPSGRVEPERLAARFAAKEAVIKALPGAGEEVRLTQIELVRDPAKGVTVQLTGRALALLDESGGSEVAVSITHEDGFAAAAAIVA
jgi:holo-[acyl-carrier protein] synthase